MHFDPYAVLNVPYSADELEIQQAFQKLLDGEKDRELIIEAYGMIRDAKSREKFRWSDFRYCEAKLDQNNQYSMDMEAVIKELAFLSPWEMGDDA